jgi:hypothetical protein
VRLLVFGLLEYEKWNVQRKTSEATWLYEVDCC